MNECVVPSISLTSLRTHSPIARTPARNFSFTKKEMPRSQPRKTKRRVGEGGTAEFDIMVGDMEVEAFNVTGHGGGTVQDNPYATDTRRFWSRWLARRCQRRAVINYRHDPGNDAIDAVEA